MAKKSLGVRELTRRKRNQDWARYKYLYRKRYEEAVRQGYDMSRVPSFPSKPEGNITKRELDRAKKSYRDIIDKATNPLGDTWREAHKRGYDYQAKRDEVYDAYMRDKYGDEYDEMVENQQLTETLLPTEVVALDRAELYEDSGYEYQNEVDAMVSQFERDVEDVYTYVMNKATSRQREEQADSSLQIFRQYIASHYYDEEFANQLYIAYEQGRVVTEYEFYSDNNTYNFLSSISELTIIDNKLQTRLDIMGNEMSNATWNDEILDEFNQTDDYKLE